MPKKIAPLSDKKIESLSRADGRYAVGGCEGLYLNVRGRSGLAPKEPGGSCAWELTVTMGKRINQKGEEVQNRITIGKIGTYPMVSLSEARLKGEELRNLAKRGINPLTQRKATALKVKGSWTFSQCADAYITAKAPEWRNTKHQNQWRNTIATYVKPIIGELLASDVQLHHITSILQPIWIKKTETATRLRGRLEKILDWAATMGHRPKGYNPAEWQGNLDGVLPAPDRVATKEHHPSLPFYEISEFMLELRTMNGVAARALEFLILTSSRTKPIRYMEWAQIDYEIGAWTVPAEGMKVEQAHTVPLTHQMMRIIESMPKINHLVFPSPTGVVMSDMTIAAVIKRMNKKTDTPRWIDPKENNKPIVPHGFRSTFKTWAEETTEGHSNLTIEKALAHTMPNKTEAAYMRGDMLHKRHRLLVEWAFFCDKLQDPQIKPIPFHLRNVAP